MPKKPPIDRNSLPASVGLVKEIRSELVARLDSLDNKFDGLEHRFDSLESRFVGLESRFVGLESRFVGLEHRFDGLESKFDGMRSDVNAKFRQMMALMHRTQTLMEEQRAENRIVLDGLQNLTERQDRMEVDLTEVKRDLKALQKSPHA